jgi:hypothetical protein
MGAIFCPYDFVGDTWIVPASVRTPLLPKTPNSIIARRA